MQWRVRPRIARRNQVSEALQSHDVAIANHFLDRLFEWKNVRQIVIMPRYLRHVP